MIVGPGLKTGLNILIDNPGQVGADLIVDSVAVKELYGGPAIVIDYGTATTFQLVLEDGALDSVVICPGIRISANALFSDTAKLPEFEIKKPKTILGRDTITSLQAGLFYGTVGETEYIVKKMIKDSGLSNVKVVATGGLGATMSDAIDIIDLYDSNLTLKGLNQNKKKCKG